MPEANRQLGPSVWNPVFPTLQDFMSTRAGEGRSQELQDMPEANQQLDPSVWNPVFSTRQDFMTSIENSPFLDESQETEDDILEFMCGPWDTLTCSPRADLVAEMCSGASLEELKKCGGEADRNPVALLDEGCFDGEILRQRVRKEPFDGPLTARGLYTLLKRKRFSTSDGDSSSSSSGSRSALVPEQEADPAVRAAVADSDSTSVRSSRADRDTATGTCGDVSTDVQQKSSSAHTSASTTPETDEVDAERRLIRITDPDKWAILALLYTTSDIQRPAVQDALDKYLRFKSFIGPEGLPTFEFSFHLPYYVWRSGNLDELCDNRRNKKGWPLRRTQDVTFLNWDKSSNKPTAFLCEAQVSCVLSGPDGWRYVGYGFSDRYFEEGDDPGSVVSYHEDFLSDGIRLDPFTFDIMSSTYQITDPRPYFLVVFRVHLYRALQEMRAVERKIETSVRENEQLADSGELRDEDHRNWVVKSRSLCKDLSQHVGRLVHQFGGFNAKFASCFAPFSELKKDRSFIQAIQGLFQEFEDLQKDFEDLTCRFDDLLKNLAVALNVDGNITRKLQHAIAQQSEQNARENKQTSFMLLFGITPFAIAITIFQMDQQNIDSIPARVPLFIAVAAVVIACIIAVYIATFYRKQFWVALITQWEQTQAGPKGKPAAPIPRRRRGRFGATASCEVHEDLELGEMPNAGIENSQELKSETVDD